MKHFLFSVFSNNENYNPAGIAVVTVNAVQAERYLRMISLVNDVKDLGPRNFYFWDCSIDFLTEGFWFDLCEEYGIAFDILDHETFEVCVEFKDWLLAKADENDHAGYLSTECDQVAADDGSVSWMAYEKGPSSGPELTTSTILKDQLEEVIRDAQS